MTTFTNPHERIEQLMAQVEQLKEALWDIQEFTNGYGDIAGIVHRKARAALAAADTEGQR
jgi:hypothetical protein